MLRLWSAWTIPTHARIWITGIAASHWSPSTTGTKSGATTTRPASAGTETAGQQADHARPGGGDPLRLVLDPAEGRREDALQRAAELAGRLEHRVVGDRVDAQRRGAEEAADQEPVAVDLQVIEHPVAEHVDAEAAEVAQALPREGEAAAARASAARPARS